MVERERVPQRFHDLGVIALVLHHNGVQVIVVLNVTDTAEGNVDVAIQIVIAVVDYVLQHAHHLVRNAINTNLLANRVLP